jgi:hypothetical protein
MSRVYKKGDSLQIVLAGGPNSGAVVGTAEQLQLSTVVLNPSPRDGAIAVGVIRASWGLALDYALDLTGSSILALGINRPFTAVRDAKRAPIRLDLDRAYVANRHGGMLLARAAYVHLTSDSALYSLP